MNESGIDGGGSYEYKCGKLSEIVIVSFRRFLEKTKENGLKKTLQKFLIGTNLDEFVLRKIKSQMQKRRAIELKKGLGRIDIQYRRGGIQIEPVGFLRMLIKKITITNEQIIRAFNDIIFQVEQRYIHDDNYIISKIDEIIFELSKTGIYTPKNSEEKTLYDFAMLIIANYYHGSKDIPEWITPALDSLSECNFIEKWIEFLTEHVSEIIAQVSENIFFDFKFTFDSFLVRSFLNQKTNKGQLSQMIKMFDIDIKSIIQGFAKSYVSPSFLRGARDMISDIACGLLSNSDSGENEHLRIVSEALAEDVFDLTVTFGSSGENSRAFRWYTKNGQDCKFEYSFDENFSTSYFGVVEKEEAPRTFPNINLGLISSYRVQNLFKYSVSVENIESEKLYYRIFCGGKCGKTYKLRINNNKHKTKFLIFADSQGMVEADYDKFLHLMKKADDKNQDADFMVHLGDFVDDGNNEDYWKWVLSGNVWKENAFLAVSGNHDAHKNIVAHNAGAENSVLGHFNLPISSEQNKDFGAYYSVNYGDLTLIVLNTNTGGEVGLDEKQYKWAIETARNAKTTWKILLTHKSPYSNGPHHKDPDVKLIGRQIDDIAYYGGIDLVIGGHDHVYARTPILAQGCIMPEHTEKLTYERKKYKTYVNPRGTIFVVPGTSGVKNYIQHLPAGFPTEKLLDLNTPVYSAVSVSGQELYFDAYSFDEQSGEFERIDSFGISKRETTDKIHSAEQLDELIEAVPDVPWKNHEKAIELIRKIYSEMEYSEKIKLKNYNKFVKLQKINEYYKKITSGEIAVVRTLKEFMAAVGNEKIGTIITDCSEIKFESGVSSAKKIYINRPLCIAGDAKLEYVRFVICEGACVLLKDSVCLDNTRKPYSIYPAISVFEMHDNSMLVLTENASINSGYGLGKNGYGIYANGENITIYLSSSGHNFARKGMVMSTNNTSGVKIFSGKYISQSSRYTFDVNSDMSISGGFVRSINIRESGKLNVRGGTIGDTQRHSATYPIECSGKLEIFSGTINAHSGISVKMSDGGEMIVDKNANNTVDIKGKILYN